MNLGQVYTAPVVADFMVNLFDLPYDSRVLDPCFGGGAFVNSLTATSKYHIDAIEIDASAFCSFHPISHQRLNLFCSSFFDHITADYDGIIMNPPYVRQEEIDLMSSIGVTKKTLRKRCSKFNIPSKANLYVYFIIYAIELLKNDGGQLIIIFPNSWKNSTLAPFMNHVFSTSGYISNFISVEGNPFVESPLVDVCILKFIKGRNGTTVHQSLKVLDNKVSLKSISSDKISFNSNSVVPLNSLCTIKRGLTTFYNKMFVNPTIHDTQYLVPILSSPKSLNGWVTEGAVMDQLLLLPLCDDLPNSVKDYLHNFKLQILREGKPHTLKKRINSTKYWYVLSHQNPGDIIFPYIIRYQPNFIINTNAVIVRDNFYLISSQYDKFLLFALLNNYYVYSQLEYKGKNYGNGLLKIQKYDVDSILVVNPSILDENIKYNLNNLAFKLISTRNSSLISEITLLLEPFYPVKNIEEIYNQQKKSRLKI